MLLSFILRGLLRWRSYQETCDALMLLDDHILHDINVGRKDIQHRVRDVVQAKYG